MSEKRDPFDGEYIGNVFGPKLTLYGGILILFFTGLALYRHWSLGVPFGWEEPKEESATTPFDPDTLKLQE
jgi:hypothetical protein